MKVMILLKTKILCEKLAPKTLQSLKALRNQTQVAYK